MGEIATWRSLYPFASRERQQDGHRYHFLDEGQGEPLLLVHGNPTWSFYWRNLILALRSRRRCVAPDHLGCGLSDKPQSYDYTLSRHVENLVALVEDLDLRDITLVVHDWGGPIGLGAALRIPERFARLVILNTGVFPPPYVPWRIRACRLPVVGTWAIRRLNLFARAALWMAMARPGRLSTAARGGLLAPYDNWHNRVAIDQFVRDIPLSRRHPTWSLLQTMEQQLSSLSDRPTLLMWGMRDWCFRPVCLERMREHFPSGEVERLAQAGHYVMEDAAEEVCRRVAQFLDGHPLARRG